MCQTVSSLASLGQMMEEYRPRLLAMLQRRIDPSLATVIDPADVLTETFLAARNRWERALARSTEKDGDADDEHEGTVIGSLPYAWFYRLSRDTLIEIYRRHTRQKRDVRLAIPWPEASSIQLGQGLVHQGTSPSEVLVREELNEQIRRIVNLLREKDREILWMRHSDDLTFPEIAVILQTAENTLMMRYARALHRLRALWRTVHGDGAQG